MKILLVNATSAAGSTGQNCRDILEELERQGEEGYIAFSQGECPPNGYRIGKAAEKKLHALFSRIFGLQGYFSWFGTWRLLRYLDKIKPDIIHLNNVHSNFINLNLLFRYLQKRNLAVVVNLHDCWFYTGKCCHYTEAGCDRWQTGCHDCPKLKAENSSWFFDRTPTMWKDKRKNYETTKKLYVVGVSDWIAREAQRSILNSAKEIVRIYNWVDLEAVPDKSQEQCKKEKGLEDKFIILGVASVWDESKGISRFKKLAEMLDDDCRILLIGSHTEEYADHSRIVKISPVHQMQELMQYYVMADVFVTMSYEESFGKVSAEALACGTPAVCFDSTANSEIVGEGCGYIAEKGNLQEVYSVIERIRKEGKKHYSAKCRQYAENHFEKQKNVAQYIALYKRIIKENEYEK